MQKSELRIRIENRNRESELRIRIENWKKMVCNGPLNRHGQWPQFRISRPHRFSEFLKVCKSDSRTPSGFLEVFSSDGRKGGETAVFGAGRASMMHPSFHPPFHGLLETIWLRRTGFPQLPSAVISTVDYL